jgi:hypothetical protein
VSDALMLTPLAELAVVLVVVVAAPTELGGALAPPVDEDTCEVWET